MAVNAGPVIAVIAGEESGDARAAAVLGELRRLLPGVRFFGAGGPRCAALGEPGLGGFDVWIERAAVVGLWDVLRRYPYFRGKFEELKGRIVEARPDAVVFVDYPGFNLRMAKALRGLLPEARMIYYISPQVWAWNEGRIGRMARWLDLMVCLFPFEPELYEGRGLRAVFAGHPLVEETLGMGRWEREEGLVGLFPGSREREVVKLFPEFLRAVEGVRESVPEVRVEVAAARREHAEWMAARAREAGWPQGEPKVTVGRARELMCRATVGLVCSGTATLEAALLGLPYALAYKVNWLTWEVGRRLVKVRHLGMVNILAGRTVVREFLQGRCRGAWLADELLRLLNDAGARERLRREMAAATGRLGGPGAARRAAEAIARELLEGRRRASGVGVVGAR